MLTELYIKTGDLSKALVNARQTVVIEPGNIERYRTVIDLLYRMKRFDEMAATLAEARRNFPRVASITHLYAVALSQAKRNDEAVKAFAEAEKEAENSQPEMLDARFYFDYGGAAERAGNHELAATMLKKSIDLDPANASEAYNYLGYMWVDLGQNLDEAELLIRRALAMEPSNGAYIDSLGWLYYHQGKYQEALTELLRAAEALPEPDPTVYGHVADAYRKLGKTAEAVLYWQKALALDPDNKEFIAKLDEASKKVVEQPEKNQPATRSAAGWLARSFVRIRLLDELEMLDRRDQSRVGGFLEELVHGFAAEVAVIEREVIDVHADELVRERDVHSACVLHAVHHRRAAMLQAVGDALAEDVAQFVAHLGREVLADDVAAERERDAAARALPPFAKVENELEPLVGKGELALVDDETHVGLAGFHGIKDFVKGHHHVVEALAEIKLGGEEGARHQAGDGDLLAEEPLLAGLVVGVVGQSLGGGRDKHRAVAVAHARAAGQEGVLVEHVGQRVDGDGGDVQLAAGRRSLSVWMSCRMCSNL